MKCRWEGVQLYSKQLEVPGFVPYGRRDWGSGRERGEADEDQFGGHVEEASEGG